MPVAKKILNEAEVCLYQDAAESIKTNGQTLTRTTVMNKVHSIERESPEMVETPKETIYCKAERNSAIYRDFAGDAFRKFYST